MKNCLFRIGTAGWGIPMSSRNYFPSGNSLLEQYSQVFNAVEINTSFYRPHKKTTYCRWAAATPPDFQFAVKIPKQITHSKRLVGAEIHLDRFIEEVSGLQSKLGPLLVQLPPSLNFELEVANHFFALLRNKFKGKIVLEPRHISWAHGEVATMLQAYHIDRVIADPVKVATKPNMKQLFSYYRLHGSPEIYSSSYDARFLEQLGKALNHPAWVIFDNTKSGAAIQNALDLKQLKENKSTG